jgi:hypothetical protein
VSDPEVESSSLSHPKPYVINVVMKRSVTTWVVTSPPESSGEVSMSELGHLFFSAQ